MTMVNEVGEVEREDLVIVRDDFWALHVQQAAELPAAHQDDAEDQNRDPDRAAGKQLMHDLIDALSHDVPNALPELATLGRTLKKRAADVLAYFDRPGTSNGPTEAINGRLEHLRGSALGFRNLTNYVARCLLEAGGFRPQLHPRL